jgi:hypothetical protein
LPTNLFESVDTLPGFEVGHKSAYYAYLIANPDITRVFINLPLSTSYHALPSLLLRDFS